MATMIPKDLSEYIRTDYLRRAECNVYDRLNGVLDDTFTVFYSRPYMGINADGSEKDRECDFIIAHPDHGFLVIEVKGGGIVYNPDTNKWYTIDRYNVDHEIKDPVKQARDGKYAILEKLKDSKHHLPEWVAAYKGVIFPDSKQSFEDLGIDKPRELFCFFEDFRGNFKEWILSRFGNTATIDRRKNVLGRSGMNALNDLLAKPIQLHAPLITYLSEDEKVISTLTTEQYQTLDQIEEIPRVIIRGGAGTGKTILAMEEAVRRADQGMRVLLTCYNRPLASHMIRKLASEANITVTTFHSLCSESIKNAGLCISDGIDDGSKFRDIFPELFIKSLQILKSMRFDIIIIDEGQDFLPSWITALDAALDPDGKQFVRIFYDSNQKIYHDLSAENEGFRLSPIKLTRNLRNTKKIHNLVKHFYTGPLIEAKGPLGQEPEFIPAESDDEKRVSLSATVSGFIQNENVKPSDITILVETKSQIDVLAPKNKIAGHICGPCEIFIDNTMVFDTVRRFKGLEDKIVLVVLSPGMFLDEELLYIALSRARTQLVVIGPSTLLSMLHERCTG